MEVGEVARLGLLTTTLFIRHERIPTSDPIWDFLSIEITRLALRDRPSIFLGLRTLYVSRGVHDA